MKRIFLFLLIFTFVFSFSSCSLWQKDVEEDKNGQENIEYLGKIIELQTQLNTLTLEYSEYIAASTVKLEELSQEIAAIKKAESEAGSASIVDPEKEEYLYELTGETATFTGYTGGETILVIPSHIDGYPIIKIGEKALASSKLTTVIISDGVKEIDWFAFMSSPFLVNITIPKSVTKIGYSAFDGCSSSLTIYCERDSYAHSYAESFGIPYVLT